MGYRRYFRKLSPEEQQRENEIALFIGGFFTYGILWLVLAWYIFTEDKNASRRRF